MQTSPEEEVERYLRNGEHDGFFCAWPGKDLFARARYGHAALRGALIATVRRRTEHATVPEALATLDVAALTRAKVAPMVRGLFSWSEQETVLDVFARSVIFLTPATIDTVLEKTQWLPTAWDLANLYLASFGAELLSEGAPEIVGLSGETTCYVSAQYFREQGRFDDFVVHEAAHIFHNCKRRTIGLREIRGREWLLEIDFVNRETFAYACEAFSRILELGDGLPTRRKLPSALEEGPMPTEERLDAGEYIDILREAIAARNGWKRILARCAAPRQAHRRRLGAAVQHDASPDCPCTSVSIATFRDDPLYPRIARAVAAILEKGKVVAPVDFLVGMALLAPDQLEAWRQGRLPYLEQVIDCNLTRLSRLLRILRFHARDLKLVSSTTVYVCRGKGRKQRLRFTKTGDAKLEEAYARHFVWPGKGPLHPMSNAWITLAGERGALCLSCADLDHLVFLRPGDAALTRRARKHSTLSAVVLRWSRARNRYERQVYWSRKRD